MMFIYCDGGEEARGFTSYLLEMPMYVVLQYN